MDATRANAALKLTFTDYSGYQGLEKLAGDEIFNQLRDYID